MIEPVPNVGTNDLERIIRELRNQITALRNEDTDWVTPTLLNSWVQFDARTVQYRRKNGFVICRGLAKNGIMGTAAFNLNTGFRPKVRVPNEHHFPCTSNSAFGSAFIDASTGAVVVGVGSNVWFDFSGVYFIAEA